MVLITFTDPERLDQYRARHELPFPVLIDRDRSAYRAFGLGRGTVGRVWGRQAGRRYLELLRAQGLSGLAQLARPTEDTLQLGGDFVVDATGRLAWGFWGEGPDDRPGVDELVAAVEAVGA